LLDGRIAFAGEHGSATSFSTAHGAYRSGLDAAERLLRAAGRLPPED
jgi:monoamine oxidase